MSNELNKQNALKFGFSEDSATLRIRNECSERVSVSMMLLINAEEKKLNSTLKTDTTLQRTQMNCQFGVLS